MSRRSRWLCPACGDVLLAVHGPLRVGVLCTGCGAHRVVGWRWKILTAEQAVDRFWAQDAATPPTGWPGA